MRILCRILSILGASARQSAALRNSNGQPRPIRNMRVGFTVGTVPNEVVTLSFERRVSPMAAWRGHFAVTQAKVAARIGITQAAYAQMERVKQPRKATLEKVATAMGLAAEQLPLVSV